MKKRYQQLMQEVNRFLTLQRRFNEKTTIKITLKNTVISLGYSLFILIVPLLIVVNLFIFDYLRYVLIGFIVLIVFAFVRLYYYFYQIKMIHDVKTLERLNVSFMFKVERIIVYIILTIFGLIVLGATI
jgi:hypothetical protein